MSNQVIQIKSLFEQGNSADQIAEMLGYEVTDVLIVLNSLGLVKAFNGSLIVARAQNESTVSPDQVIPEAQASDIFKQYQVAVAQKIVALALDDDPNAKGVQAKAAMYVNEEATGRNEKRAAKTVNHAAKIINIDKLLMHINNAKSKLNTIDVSDGQIVLNA